MKSKKNTKNKQKQEVTAIGKAIRTLGGLGGGVVGGYLGQSAAGSALGTGLGALVSKWLGYGDYKVSMNSLVTKSSASIPAMHSTQQSVVVRHKEFLGTIAGSGNFTIQRELVINPGLVETFPWLSQIAQSYQQYKIRGMVYHYIPTSGIAVSSTNSSLGSVMIQTSYRSNDSSPNDKVELLNEYWSNEVVPSEQMIHPIECDPKENPFNIHYVRGGAVPVNDSPLMYDIGRTYVATQGMQSTNIVGDLWVTYEIEFKKPVVRTNVSATSYEIVEIQSSFSPTFFDGPVSRRAGDLPVTFGGRTLTFPPGTQGNYLVRVALISNVGFGGSTSWNGLPTYSNMSSSTQAQSFLGTTIATQTLNNVIYYNISVFKPDTSTTATMQIPAPAGLTGNLNFTELAVTYLK
jgi:hypothetical protein